MYYAERLANWSENKTCILPALQHSTKKRPVPREEKEG